MKNGNKIGAVILALMLVLSFVFSAVTIVVKADSLIDFVVYYAEADGSWSSYTLEEIPADTLLEIGTSAIYQEGVDAPLYTYSQTYEMYTEDFSALDSPSDAVSAVSYALPLEMEANIGYVILHGLSGSAVEDPIEVELNIRYPDQNGNMMFFSTTVLEGAFIEISEEGVYLNGSEDLLTFGKECNAYLLGDVGDYNSTVTPTAALPVELTAYEGMPRISVYNYALKPTAPVIRYNSDDDSITWIRDANYTYQIKIVDPDGTEMLYGTYGLTEAKIYPYDYVSELGENTIYVRSVVYAGGDTRLPMYSEWSNGVLWTAELPLINAFYLDGSKLHIDVSGKEAVVQLIENGLLLDGNFGTGAKTYELTKSGLNGYRIVAMNRYGYVSSDTVDYYVGYAGDTLGTFYAIGQVVDGCVEMLDSISFFGMSLWGMMVTSFFITLFISFLTLIVLQNRGAQLTRGGNSRNKYLEQNQKEFSNEFKNQE